jgi:hypothetical protein
LNVHVHFHTHALDRVVERAADGVRGPERPADGSRERLDTGGRFDEFLEHRSG